MQIVINGLIGGLTIALLAVAFSIVYQPTRILYVALGSIYTFSPFVAWACLKAGCPWSVAIVVTVLAGIALSLLFELANHSLLERKGATAGVHLVSSLGIYILVVHAIALIWGNETKVLRAGLDNVLKGLGVTLTGAQIIAGVVCAVLLLGFFLWVRQTDLGLQFRGLADNPVEMALRGYDLRRLRLLAFGLSGFLASTSSLLVAYDLGFDPHGGLHAVMLAIVATIIGGRRSLYGPAIGAVLLGVVRSEVVWLLSARWQEAVTFALLAAFLVFRPDGIIRRRIRLEATP